LERSTIQKFGGGHSTSVEVLTWTVARSLDAEHG